MDEIIEWSNQKKFVEQDADISLSPVVLLFFLPYKKFLTFLFAFTQSTLELIQVRSVCTARIVSYEP